MRSTQTLEEIKLTLRIWDKLHAVAWAHAMNELDIVQLEPLTMGDVYILLSDLDRRMNKKERGIP